MAVTDDEWANHIASFEANEHVLAIGAFSLDFNALELSLSALVGAYLPDQAEARHYLFAQLHNRQRMELIRKLSGEETDAAVRDAVDYALSCFAICCDNRNLVMHAAPGRLEGSKFMMFKLIKDNPGFIAIYDMDLADIRAAAVAARDVEFYVFNLYTYITDRSGGPKSLPGRPPKPRTLSLSRRPKAPET